MPNFVVKVTLSNGDLLSPMTVSCESETAAIALARSQPFIEAGSQIDAKTVRGDVMKRAFGVQDDGKIVVRSDWLWSPDGEPVPPAE